MTGHQLVLLLIGLAFGACTFACYRWTWVGAYLILGGRLWMFLLVLAVAWGAQMLLLVEALDFLLAHLVPPDARRAGAKFTMAGFLASIVLLQYLLVDRRKRRR